MKSFQVYKHPILGFDAVKVGFNWPALFFGIFWMLYCKLWGKAILWVFLYITAGIIESQFDNVIVYLLYFILVLNLWLYPGFEGNSWRGSNLTSRGFKHVITVGAENKDAAIAKSIT